MFRLYNVQVYGMHRLKLLKLSMCGPYRFRYTQSINDVDLIDICGAVTAQEGDTCTC